MMKKILYCSVLLVLTLSLKAQQYGCPFVNAGADVALPCGSNCTTLTASYLPSGTTTSYTGSSITYAPYGYLNGVAPPSPFYTLDDNYSGVVNLPFTFCFFGNYYNQCVIGNNAMISFDLSYAGGSNPWQLTTATNIPSASEQLNSIMGPYMDIYPAQMPIADSNYINYATFGTTPCRKFVVSYYRVPFYSASFCAGVNLTSQIVLYETTNVIEIYIGSKPSCSSWNGGLAIEGIQNATGTVGYAVPGRNRTVWSASNDGYRFTPSGPSNVTVDWYQGGTHLTTGTSVLVCPPNNRSTSYVATATYLNCNNVPVIVSDTVNVNVLQSAGNTQYLSCPSPAASVTMNATGTGTWTAISTNPSTTNIANPSSATTVISGFSSPGTYLFAWSAGLCADTAHVIVSARPSAGPDQNKCKNDTITMNAYGTGTWSALSNNPAITQITAPTANNTTITGFAVGGAYGYVWTTSAGCSDTMFVNIPNFTISVTASSTTICQYANTAVTVTPSPSGLGPFQYHWLNASTVQSPNAGTTLINALSGSAYFPVQVTSADGCKLTDSVLVSTTALIGVNIRSSAYPTTVCPGDSSRLIVVANPNSCGAATSTCNAPGTLVTVGAGTSQINGPQYQYPSPYGNYYKSAHHQFLIHANEIIGQVPSGGQIKSLAFDIGTLNGGATLTNFTISLACTGADSLPNSFLSRGSLTQVYTAATYSAISGWNTHVFNTPYDWDGISNLIVDVCFTNTTSGSINPRMVYTTTPFKSVWCTFANDPGGECGVIGLQSVTVANAFLFRRPNMRLNMCITDLNGANLAWTPNTGANAPIPTNLDTVYSRPIATTTYQVALTSANGCVNYDLVTVNVDTSTRLTLTKDSFICTQQPVQLNAIVTGTAVNQAQVRYTWTASDGTIIPGGLGATYATVTVNPTTSVRYIVTISGGGGCTLTDSVKVTLGNGLPVTKVVDSISCAGGSNGEIDINMTAGIAPFRYTWTPTVAGNINSAVNLPAGTYIVQVMDTQGCVGRDTTKLIAPTPLTLRLDSTNILCYNVNTDNITATVTGGRQPYRYTWSPLQPNTAVINNVPAGTYSLTVHDTSGCAISGVVNITQPTQVVSGAAATNLSGAGTHDGTITLTTTGGSPAYAYTSIPSIAGLPNATNLDTGIYIINVCDANLCCVKDTAHISGPPPIVVTPTVINNPCFGQCNGQISVVAVGGVAPYTYHWNTTPASNSDTVINLCNGIYRVTITDANGISVAKSDTIASPPALGDKIDSTLISCFGATDGALKDSAYGGMGPYTIAWTPGGNNPLTGLGAGTYSVQVTDNNGCVLNDNASLGQPTLLSSVLDSTYPTRCFGDANGRAVISVTGGTKPYTIVWAGSASADTVATDLAAGAHTVTIIDAHGCASSVTLNISQPLQLSATVNTLATHCATSNDGAATALVSNGTPGYTYTWDAALGTSSITGLSVGAHTLRVVDTNGCTISQPFTVDTQYVLHILLVADSVSCFNGNDGRATVTVANGTPGYSYLWTPSGSATDPASGLSAGVQTVLVTDSFHCQAMDSVAVYQPSQLYVLPSFTQPLCKGDHNGKIWLSASGGHGPYTYTFKGVQHQISDTITGLPASDTTYIFVITDSKGCTQDAGVDLRDPSALLVDSTVTPITCANAKDGAITINASGGTPGYTYTWTPSVSSGNVAQNLAPGTYTIKVQDVNGCSITEPVTLVAPPAISFTYVRSDSTSCSYSSDGHIVVNVTGGSPGGSQPYSYAINGQAAQADSNFYNLAQGTYQIAVKDGHNCELDTTIAVYSPLPITVAVDPLDTIVALGSGIELRLLVGNVTSQTINSYDWSPTSGLSCTDCAAPVATPYQIQNYTVVVNYGKNCTTSANATVRVAHGPETYIPNAFSPNGDGTNDEFTVFGTGLKSVTLRVFNRWGEKVFDSGSDQWGSWDGSYKGVSQPTGVYTYVVELVYLDGVYKVREGSITLIR